jgi:hypothetical protein
MSKDDSSRDVHVSITAALEPCADRKPPAAAAYAFTASGQLLGRAELDDHGHAELVLRPAVASAVRVVVGPRDEAPKLAELLRRGALDREVRVAPGQRLKLDWLIDLDRWRPWLRRCLVQGRLLKRDLAAPGFPDAPVLGATIEIYEVDPLHLVLPRLPTPWLRRLRDVVLGRRPEPDPVGDRLATPELEPDVEHAFHAAVSASPELAQLRSAAAIAGDVAFTRALVGTAKLVQPWLCRLFPQLVTKRRIGTATTDSHGHFRTWVWVSAFVLDQPDLYFRATQPLYGAAPITLYAPTPVSCNTWWNYVCGTEVTLVTTDPRAVTTPPRRDVDAPANWVLFTAIGNTSLARIHGAGAHSTTFGNLGLRDDGAPWGGVLRPRLDFDSNLRDVLGVKYYQLSWRRGTAGAFEPLSAPVSRHYAVWDGSALTVRDYPLGPHPMTVDGEALQLFEVPPTAPPDGHWTVADAVRDTENGELPSDLVAPGLRYRSDGSVEPASVDESGLYQLKLELFDDAGHRVSAALAFVVPASADLTGTIPTALASSVAQPDGSSLQVGSSLVLTLHLDNNATWAGLGAPSTALGSADPCCGVVHYGPGAAVALPYTARHPHGFAIHHLSMFRSATALEPPITGGTGAFTLTRSVADLMTRALPASCAGRPPCTTAAFAEHLQVSASATDGWRSLTEYDSTATRAFALSP